MMLGAALDIMEESILDAAARLPGRMEIARPIFAVICRYRQNFWIVEMAGLGLEYCGAVAVNLSTDQDSQ